MGFSIDDYNGEPDPWTIRRIWCFLFHWSKQERVGKYIHICGHCKEIWYSR